MLFGFNRGPNMWRLGNSAAPALGYRTPAEVYQNGQEGKEVAAPEVGLPSGLVKPSVGVGDSLNLALGLS